MKRFDNFDLEGLGPGAFGMTVLHFWSLLILFTVCPDKASKAYSEIETHWLFQADFGDCYLFPTCLYQIVARVLGLEWRAQGLNRMGYFKPM